MLGRDKEADKNVERVKRIIVRGGWFDALLARDDRGLGDNVRTFPQSLVSAYARFIVLKLAEHDTTAPCWSEPSQHVDAVWRAHMLLPQQYAAMCQAVLGRGRALPYQEPPAATGDNRGKTHRATEQIFCKTIRGETITLNVHANARVLDAKMQIERQTGVPIDHQRLIFAGRQLDENCTLAEYGIAKEHTIHLTLRLSGC